jgi:hypothetical protein
MCGAPESDGGAVRDSHGGTAKALYCGKSTPPRRFPTLPEIHFSELYRIFSNYGSVRFDYSKDFLLQMNVYCTYCLIFVVVRRLCGLTGTASDFQEDSSVQFHISPH